MSLLDLPVALHEAARRRYLSYALSVIKSRALPDVRDGLKPVQRRILYAMYHVLHLTPDARYKKCASIVGDVLGKFHPHGDSSVYEALVRMAQDFTLLHPLVDGQGNFGSIDGDGAAAYRYTEARLAAIAVELLSELKQKTVDYRPNFDAQHQEPIVLPAQFPQLLVNGSEGIAVGMATSIPPHNLREVIDACLLLLEDPDADNAKLCRKVQGPDFPTGGEIVADKTELAEIYATGSGSMKVRGTWEMEQKGRKHYVIVTSIPYTVVKARLVEEIGGHIREKKLPQLTDVKDESTDTIRIVLELRNPADAEAAMAYLLKHTRLQVNVHVNLTCLIPTEQVDVTRPERLDLRRILRYWLDFRYDTVRRRMEFELGELRKRIHILEGFEKVFDLLDEAIRIIRASEGKRDAAEKLMSRFGLDDEQAEAILELKLHKLAKLEILAIREELGEKRAEAARIEGVLRSREAMWGVVRDELAGIRKQYGQARRTGFASAAAPAPTYQEDAYIVAEDVVVVVTRDGWVKRQGTVSDLGKVRVREGDSIGWALRASTRSTIAFLTSRGTAYTLRVDDLPSTTGYGEPVQKFFEFADGERVVGVLSFDPRNQPVAEPAASPDDPPPPYFIAVSRQGKGVRVSMALMAEPSKRTGRTFQRLEETDDAVIAAYPSTGAEWACLASTLGHVLCYKVGEIATVKAAGKGITAMKLDDKDSVFAFELTIDPTVGPLVLTALGRHECVSPKPYAGARGGKGRQLFKRGFFAQWRRAPEVLLGKTTTEGEA